MIAVDTNILVYAHRRDSAFHAAAAACLRGLAEGPAPWLIPWPCIHEFLAIATHPRLYAPPSTLEQAVRQVDLWMESPSLIVAGESAEYWGALREALVRAKVAGPAVHDARVAAICLEHQVEALWTADRDFGRFAPLNAVNPLLTR